MHTYTGHWVMDRFGKARLSGMTVADLAGPYDDDGGQRQWVSRNKIEFTDTSADRGCCQCCCSHLKYPQC